MAEGTLQPQSPVAHTLETVLSPPTLWYTVQVTATDSTMFCRVGSTHTHSLRSKEPIGSGHLSVNTPRGAHIQGMGGTSLLGFAQAHNVDWKSLGP